MRLPELNQEGIKLRPLLTYHFWNGFSNGLPDACGPTKVDRVVRSTNRYSSKISVLKWDRPESRGDPGDSLRNVIDRKSHVFESRCPREVNWSWH